MYPPHERNHAARQRAGLLAARQDGPRYFRLHGWRHRYGQDRPDGHPPPERLLAARFWPTTSTRTTRSGSTPTTSRWTSFTRKVTLSRCTRTPRRRTTTSSTPAPLQNERRRAARQHGAGTLIDPDALIAGLESGKIGGAGLDVIEDETGIYYYNRMGQAILNRELNLLRSYPNVIVSPHTAFYTDVNVASMVQSPFEALDAYAHGQPYAGEVQL